MSNAPAHGADDHVTSEPHRARTRWLLMIPFVGAVTLGVLAALRELHIWTSGQAHLPNGALLYFGSLPLLVALLTFIPRYWRWHTGRTIRFYKRFEPVGRLLDPGATGPHDTLPLWRSLIAPVPAWLVARAERRRDSRLCQLREATYLGTVGLTIVIYVVLR